MMMIKHAVCFCSESTQLTHDAHSLSHIKQCHVQFHYIICFLGEKNLIIKVVRIRRWSYEVPVTFCHKSNIYI